MQTIGRSVLNSMHNTAISGVNSIWTTLYSLHIALQSIPILRHFCLFTAFGVLMVYLFVMTFFIGCLVLDERRVTNRQVVSCAAPKPDSWQPSEFSRREIVPLFFDKLLTPVMFKGPAKVRTSDPFTKNTG